MKLKRGLAFSLASMMTISTCGVFFSTNVVAASKPKRVLLISVDGMHASDLASYVAANPKSTLAELSRHGITYTNALTTAPSDSFPGLLALLTGGTPNSTGVFYDDSYDRKLLPPVSAKSADAPGTEVLFDESIEYDDSKLDGGASSNNGASINPDKLPRDGKTSKPVYPHSYLRTNTIFEVLKAAGKYTAWSDKHYAYDLVNGPSGNGVDDLYTPEITSANGTSTYDASTKDVEAYDDIKVSAIINEIDGKNSTGTAKAEVPAIFGMNFQEVSVTQKLATGGYADASGTFSQELRDAFNHTDKSLAKIVSELKSKNLYDSTEIIITAKHGQSPIDSSLVSRVSPDSIVAGVDPTLLAQVTGDDFAMIWLTDQSKTAEVVSQIEKNKDSAKIQNVSYYGSSNWLFNNPATDSRVPDIIVQSEHGVIYTNPKKTKIAEHGGFLRDDRNVGLLVSYAAIPKAVINTDQVSTTQVAPSIVSVFGIDINKLQSVKAENTKILPELEKYSLTGVLSPTMAFG